MLSGFDENLLLQHNALNTSDIAQGCSVEQSGTAQLHKSSLGLDISSAVKHLSTLSFASMLRKAASDS